MGMIMLVFVLSLLNGTQALTELLLSGKIATQSETWSDKVASLAIDGNDTSYSVTASQSNASALGWWEVDLGNDYQIGQVAIKASNDHYNAKYLQHFSIVLFDENRNEHLCYEYDFLEHFTPSESKSFPCSSDPFNARYIRIKRLGGDFRPDALALAEVRVLTGFNGPDKFGDKEVPRKNPDSGVGVPRKNPDSGVGGTIRKSTIKAVQSGTFDNHDPLLALDDDPNTFTSAVASTEVSQGSPVAWWQADLGAFYNVTQVDITSPLEDQYAKHLESFSIDIYPVSIIDDHSLPDSIPCIFYPADSYILPGKTEKFTCNAPVYGRYLIVRKVWNINSITKYLSIAEITIHYK